MNLIGDQQNFIRDFHRLVYILKNVKTAEVSILLTSFFYISANFNLLKSCEGENYGFYGVIFLYVINHATLYTSLKLPIDLSSLDFGTKGTNTSLPASQSAGVSTL
jgi:hypothetical protein